VLSFFLLLCLFWGDQPKDNAALRMPFLLPNLLALPPFQTIEHDTDC